MNFLTKFTMTEGCSRLYLSGNTQRIYYVHILILRDSAQRLEDKAFVECLFGLEDYRQVQVWDTTWVSNQSSFLSLKGRVKCEATLFLLL